jgi:hypothetical protein
MAQEEGFTIIDGTADIEEQQKQVRDKMMKLLPRGVTRTIAGEEKGATKL